MAVGSYTPVIAGLAVGATFIILFSISVDNNNDATEISDEISIVTISNDLDPEFEPNIIKAVLGVNNTVRWINGNTLPFTIVSDTEYKNSYGEPFSTEVRADEQGGPFVMPGQFFEFTFTEAGTFNYYSVPHPQMRGTVVVFESGSPDDAYTEVVNYHLKQEIENTPLIVNVTEDQSTGIVDVSVIHRFILENSDGISAHQVYPTWKENNTLDAEMLTDRNGRIIPHSPIFHDALLSAFDANCPYSEITIGDDGSISGSSTNKETTVYYGSRVSMQLEDNFTGIAYYNYSLGIVEPYRNDVYRLTFVTPYEAEVNLSESINMLSYERSNCAVTNDVLSIPHFDILFKIDK